MSSNFAALLIVAHVLTIIPLLALSIFKPWGISQSVINLFLFPPVGVVLVVDALAALYHKVNKARLTADEPQPPVNWQALTVAMLVFLVFCFVWLRIESLRSAVNGIPSIIDQAVTSTNYSNNPY